MRRRLAGLVAWGAAGHAVVLGLFVWLVNVPDSNLWMLALSALLCVALFVIAAVVEVTGAAWLIDGSPFRTALRRGARGPLPFAAAVLVGVACWWASARILEWHLAHRGEIDAWFAATFDTARTEWLHRVVGAGAFLLRWVVGASLAAAVLTTWLRSGARAVLSLGWLRTGLAPRVVALTALGVVLFVALPWQVVEWRPRRLPANWVEPAFVGTKLLLVYLVAHLGWATVLIASGRPWTTSRPHAVSGPAAGPSTESSASPHRA